MKFKQRLNERSVINPSGFTGIISQNSNIKIDKSFIKKGTTFVNAFDNSNVVIKDCASPSPTYKLNENYYYEKMQGLKNEISTRKLPPWVHYGLFRFGEGIDDGSDDVKIDNWPALTSQFYKELKDSSPSTYYYDEAINKELSDARALLTGSAVNADGIWTAPLSTSIDITLASHEKDTSLISRSNSGYFWLGGLNSSIKAVIPFNSNFENTIECPSLQLNLTERELYPFKANESAYFVTNLYKKNEYGEDEYDRRNAKSGDVRAKNTYNRILSGWSSNDFNGQSKFNKTADNKYYYVLNLSLDSFGNYHIDGPLHQNLSGTYTRITHANADVDNLNVNYILNDEKDKNEQTYWFKYLNKAYSLYRLINGKETLPESFAVAYDTDFLTLKNNNSELQISTLSGSDKGLNNINRVTSGDFAFVIRSKTAESAKERYFNFDGRSTDTISSILGYTMDDLKSMKNHGYVKESPAKNKYDDNGSYNLVVNGINAKDIANNIYTSISAEYATEASGHLFAEGSFECTSISLESTLFDDFRFLSDDISGKVASSVLIPYGNDYGEIKDSIPYESLTGIFRTAAYNPSRIYLSWTVHKWQNC